MATFYAQPYSIDHTGFYFEDMTEFETGMDKLNALGCEEVEIQFIDGDDHQADLAKAAEIIEEAETHGALAPGNATERAALLWASLNGIVQTHKLGRLAPGVFKVRIMAREVSAALALRWGTTAAKLEAALAASERLRIRVPARIDAT